MFAVPFEGGDSYADQTENVASYDHAGTLNCNLSSIKTKIKLTDEMIIRGLIHGN